MLARLLIRLRLVGGGGNIIVKALVKYTEMPRNAAPASMFK